MAGEDVKPNFIRYLIFAQSECDETIVHLGFLFETDSLKDKTLYRSLRDEYDLLGKQLNKFIQWVEEKFEFKTSKPTGYYNHEALAKRKYFRFGNH